VKPLALLVLLATSVAHAEPEPSRPPVTIGLGYGVLGLDAGPEHGTFAAGVHGALVLTHRTVSLAVDGFLGPGVDGEEKVRTRRLGASLRWELGRKVIDDPHVALSVWVEAGAGRHRLRWDYRPTVERHDLHAGVIFGGIKRWGARGAGVDVGLRLIWARWHGDTMTPPHVNDLGLAWTLSGVFR
jgi:hypothetical protein